MDIEDAKKIARIAGTVDDGCPGCVDEVVDKLKIAFPQFTWERTREHIYEQPDWSDDPGDKRRVGLLVNVSPSPQ